MLVRYFKRPSRIEQLRSNTGGYLLEGFAKELSQGRYQWVAARKHIRAAEHFLHWIAHRNLSITSVEDRYAQQVPRSLETMLLSRSGSACLHLRPGLRDLP